MKTFHASVALCNSLLTLFENKCNLRGSYLNETFRWVYVQWKLTLRKKVGKLKIAHLNCHWWIGGWGWGGVSPPGALILEKTL